MPETKYEYSFEINGVEHLKSQSWKLDKTWGLVVTYDDTPQREPYLRQTYKNFSGARQAATRLQSESNDQVSIYVVEIKLKSTKEVMSYWERNTLNEQVEHNTKYLEVITEVIAGEPTIDGKNALQRLADKYIAIINNSQAKLDSEQE